LIKTTNDYCARKIHVFSALVVIQQTTITNTLVAPKCLFYPITFSRESGYHFSNASHLIYFIMHSQ